MPLTLTGGRVPGSAMAALTVRRLGMRLRALSTDTGSSSLRPTSSHRAHIRDLGARFNTRRNISTANIIQEAAMLRFSSSMNSLSIFTLPVGIY